MNKEKKFKTAYDEYQSNLYDIKRFTSPQGKFFSKLETEQLQRVLEELIGTSEVLEVGCGTGRFMKTVLDAGHNAYGIDLSPYMLGISKVKCKNAKLTLGEGSNLPYHDKKFDLVYSIRILNQVESREYAFRMILEMIRVTKPRGILLIEFCNSRRPNLSRKKDAILLSINDIRKLLKDAKKVHLVNFRGILILSQTFLQHIPNFLLQIWALLDRILSQAFPSLTARCYITLKKIN